MLAKQQSQAEALLSSAHILIVDDEAINRTIVSENLNSLYRVSEASSGEEALEMCLASPPDLVLLDVVMDGMSGLQLCQILKQHELTDHVPVIFLTAMAGEQAEENRCWDAGAVDFVGKPFNGQTLRNRIKVHLLLKFQQDLLRKQSLVDGLTGLFNRHMLEENYQPKLREVKRSGEPCSLLLIDVDWFKPFNDTYGHLEGDECLKHVAETLKVCLRRPSDLAIRYGGEEFLGVLPQTGSSAAELVAKSVLRAVENLNIPHKKSKFKKVTVSIGVYTIEKSNADEDGNVILERADQALYQAKKAGRNHCKVYCPGQPKVAQKRKVAN